MLQTLRNIIMMMVLWKKISYKIKAPTFVDALSVSPPTGPISNHLLNNSHNFHLLYKEIQTYQK
jgi:hypothetical protein